MSTSKADFYEKNFKHLVCHHGYVEGNYCPRVVTGFSTNVLRYCWLCKFPFCTSDGHIITCQRCFHMMCQKCCENHDCCDHTDLPDEWVEGCENCSRPVCEKCVDNHNCPC